MGGKKLWDGDTMLMNIRLPRVLAEKFTDATKIKKINKSNLIRGWICEFIDSVDSEEPVNHSGD